MSYEAQQARLLRLLEEVPSDSEIQIDSEEDCSEDESNDWEVQSESTDTEQDASSSESDEEDYERKRKRIPCFTAKDGAVWWKHTLASKREKTRRENIITYLPGVKGVAKQAKTITECWNLFISEYMLDTIVEYTNKFIEKNASNYTRDRSALPTDKIEVKALLGLLYLAGCLKGARLNLQELWDRKGCGVEMFWLTMSLGRFRFLLRMLRFDDWETRDIRKAVDKFAPIRTIFDKFVSNCREHYVVGNCVTIDEKLEAFRGRCSFRQYLPKKPNKYGIKIFALVDSKMCYTKNLEVYVGEQPIGPFKVNNDSKSIVERLVIPISGSSRNVTCDNWFTSLPLINDLLKNHRLTYVGTIRKNRRGIPLGFKNTKSRSLLSSMFGFQKDVTLVSYVPKPNKNVLLASSLHHNDVIDTDSGDHCKPNIITFYNAAKSGVDTLDQLCSLYNVPRNTKRWPMVVFYSIMNVAGVNAQIIYNSNNPDNKNLPRRSFLKTIALSLLDEHFGSQKCTIRSKKETARSSKHCNSRNFARCAYWYKKTVR